MYRGKHIDIVDSVRVWEKSTCLSNECCRTNETTTMIIDTGTVSHLIVYNIKLIIEKKYGR